MSAVTTACLVVLSISLLLVVVFVLRARGLVDRSLGLDTMMSIVLNGLAVVIVMTGDPDVVVLALLIAVLAFIGTVTVARFVERRGNSVAGEEQ
jgi:multicomponent Na+:H+ antiporter subunit F